MLARAEQYSNAALPTMTTFVPKVRVVRLGQPKNASIPMFVTVSGTVYEVARLATGYAINVSWLLSNKTPAKLLKEGLFGSTVIEIRPGQS